MRYFTIMMVHLYQSEPFVKTFISCSVKQAVVCLWREKWMGIEPIICILIEIFPFRIFQ